IVTPDATVEKIGERLQASADKYGEAIGRVLEAADTVGAKFDMDAFVQRARRELLQPMLVNGQPDPALARVVESLDNLLQQYEGLGNVSFSTANQLKSNLQKLVNWGNQFNESRANLSNEMLIDLQHALLNEIDDQLG